MLKLKLCVKLNCKSIKQANRALDYLRRNENNGILLETVTVPHATVIWWSDGDYTVVNSVEEEASYHATETIFVSSYKDFTAAIEEFKLG